MNKQFKAVKKGNLFERGGNVWLKRSSRTAEIIQPDRFKGTWFYFGMDEQVKELEQ